ncbi:MAG: NADH-quinone oxidoreductase subunit L [Deltaproteobacteria bacterium]|nr:NADH-quinone oxidoreductase subunit L [Deltaproteobacteria bacterium]
MVETVAPTDLLRWIPLLPLFGALVHGVLLALVRRALPRGLVIALSVGAPALAFVVTLLGFFQLRALPGSSVGLVDEVYTWIGAGRVVAEMSFLLDPLSVVMCLVVLGVGTLIHVYSIGYMDDDHREDGGFQRFFCYLNLFLCAMLMLVLGDNLLVLFLGWEGVGLCSYLLIGFWYGDRWNAYCGLKAFVVNRIGDFGFLIGIFLLLWALADVGATLNFRELEAALPRIVERSVAVPGWLGGSWRLTTLIGVCLFVGAMGKSAQIPLYVWLPDAMAGPTPVSALIHAATMVTAGVYMVCRMSFLYEAAPGASALIAWTGAITALFAATIAITQTDIKKVLAYSTVSQLGYMFLAAGCGAYSAAIFHVGTHAFFKALLFLGAGAVILALHHEQDTDRMGGLRRRLRRTHAVFLVGVLAIAGLPPFSGFFSKDEVLLSAWLAHDVPGHQWLWAIGVVTAAITAFYMFRLHFRTFAGASRVEPQVEHHGIHEPAATVLWPLYVLAFFAIVGGFAGLPQAYGDLLGVPDSNSLSNFLRRVVRTQEHHVAHSTEFALAGVATLAAALGAAGAWLLYVARPELPARIRSGAGALHRLLANKYYVDELYDALFVRPLIALSDHVLFRGIDAGLIDGVAVNGSARFVRSLADDALKYLQGGLTQGYLITMVAGTFAVLAWLLAA